MNVVSYRPELSELSYTFGGRPAVRRIQPGTIVEMYTEDCFAGGYAPSTTCPRASATSPT